MVKLIWSSFWFQFNNKLLRHGFRRCNKFISRDNLHLFYCPRAEGECAIKQVQIIERNKFITPAKPIAYDFLLICLKPTFSKPLWHFYDFSVFYLVILLKMKFKRVNSNVQSFRQKFERKITITIKERLYSQ